MGENHRRDKRDHAGCDHEHSHASNQTVLRNSFLIIFIFMLIEAGGGIVTNSLALLSDAGHMLSDAAALGLSLLAFKFGEKKGTLKNTFGFKRVEILAAAINALTLVAIAVWVIVEAIERFKNPPQVATSGMLAVAVIGLVVNIVTAVYMLRNGDTKENVNMRAAYLHVLSDLLGSLGAVAAALAMIWFDWKLADPIASVFISILIAKSGWNLLKTTFHILMEGAPANIDMNEILSTIGDTCGVKSVHDMHVWSITSGLNAMSAHIVVDEAISVAEAQKITREIERKLKALNIHHVTLQTESEEYGHEEEMVCDMRSQGNAGHFGHAH